MKALAFAALSMLALTGCQQSLREEVSPQALTGVEKLVVTGFISPQDTLLSVSVTRSQAIAGTGASPGDAVTNASVTLTDGGSSVTLLFHAKRQRYEASTKKWPVVSGRSYSLLVQTPDGQRVSGSCTVPQPVTLRSVRLDSSIAADGSKRFFARYAWQAAPGDKGQFQTAGTFIFVKGCATCRAEAVATQKTESVPVSFGSSTALSAWVLGETTVGTTLETKGNLSTTDPKGSFGSTYRRATVKAALLHVDDVYARYHQAVEKATRTEATPFSEAVLIPTNLQGGLGCFAAYTRASLTVTLR